MQQELISNKEKLQICLEQLDGEIAKALKLSILPYLKIDIKQDNNLSSIQSKFGGLPYLPKGIPYPKDKDGVPLSFVGQINFKEILPLPFLPENGIISFFYQPGHSHLGEDYNNPIQQNYFKVMYFEDSSLPCESDFTFLETLGKTYGEKYNYAIFKNPFPGYRLIFSLLYMPMTHHNYLYHDQIASKAMIDPEPENTAKFIKWCEEKDQKMKVVENFLRQQLGYHEYGSRIGGYPIFAQDDPRHDCVLPKPMDFLLLQVDSTEDGEILVADRGTMNFFINSEDLAKRNFSDILYSCTYL